MKIIEIEALHNGAHRNQSWDSAVPPAGWAVIPDNMELPASFPFVGVEVEEVTHYRENMVEREVTKTREVVEYHEVPVLDEEGQPTFDEEGNPLTTIEEYTEMETVTEQEPYTVMTVTKMTEGVMPELPPEPEPEPEKSVWDELDEAYQEGVNYV